MKLISMTDFVIENNLNATKDKSLLNTDWFKEFEINYKKIVNYANFLKQPLKLEMFVPCDERGIPINKPNNETLHFAEKTVEYNQAKEKVLFEGFEFEDKFHWGFEVKYKEEKDFIHIQFSNEYNIEYLILNYSSTDFLLTPNAIKQIGL